MTIFAGDYMTAAALPSGDMPSDDLPPSGDLPPDDGRADGWLAEVPRSRLRPEQGAAVLLPGGTSAAVFLLHDGSVYAVGNLDPFFGAPVMCHGIVGDRAGTPTVASPLGKQVFSLLTGQCLDDPSVSLPVFELSERDDGVIYLSKPGNDPEIYPRQS